MVRAILAGAKTQTRRVCKPAANLSAVVACQDPATYREGQRPPYLSPGWFGDEEGDVQFFCPYGSPGDRLWVRETFAKIDGQTQPWIETDYRATYTHGDRMGDALGIKKRWTPGIHMPRAASRITLAVESVRVERLQDITHADAEAEGIAYSERFGGYCIEMAEHFNSHDPRESYWSLWEAINGAGSVEANPWVWVVAFKRCQDLKANPI